MSDMTKMRMLGLVAGALVALRGPAQQSDNNRLHAVPPPGTVTIDGKLDDWDLSGQIEIFANYRTRSTYSARVAAMHDAERLYLAIVWRDPTPLQNMVDADFEVGSGWKSDCVQLRMLTDLPLHIDCWNSTTAGRPVINIQYGSFEEKSRFHQSKLVTSVPKNALEAGAAQAFLTGDDGKGYVQEIALPWKLISGQAVRWKESGEPVAPPRTFATGDTLQMGIELLWGGPDGRTFPIHRYADLLKPGQTSREFFWSAENAWGPVILEAAGNLSLPVPDYATRAGACLQRGEGPVKLSYTMPYDGYATLVVENEQGVRVRNLVGMAPRTKGRQVELWDCTDEAGRLVPPGRYRYRGLTHQGIDPVYEATYGTPGIPPWDTGDGTGAWLSDHCAPRAVAAGGDMIVLGAERGESGYGIIGVRAADGRKRWGDRTLHGVHSLAADDGHAYVFLSSWDVKPTLARLDLRNGKYAPFETAAGPQLKVPVFADGEAVVWVPSFAAGPEHLALPLPRTNGLSVIRLFDKRTAAVVADVPVSRPGAIAYGPGGVLFIWSEGRVMKLAGGKLTPAITAGLPAWADAMAVDAEGRLLIASRADHVVKQYGADGRFLRDIGVPGGRPVRGAWQPDGLLNPAALAVDPENRVWVAEEHNAPRRISVWSAEGKRVRDFIGPTGYGGTGANADPDDPSRVFGSGCEFRLDFASNRAAVVSVPGDVSGQLLKMQGREYVMNKGGRLYRRDGQTLRPVAAIGNPGVKDLGSWKDIPLPPVPPGTHGYASISFVWSDLNDDGAAQTNEVVAGSRWTGWEAMKYPVGTSGYFGSYWLDDAFAIRSVAAESHGAYGGRPAMLVKTPLKGWTPGGAPVWDLAGQQLLAQGPQLSTCLYIAEKERTVTGSPLTCVRDDGTVLWTYRDNWHGVHGSHAAPIPDRDDLLVGTLGCIGRVDTPAGPVFGLHSNMGRLYLMSLDGLFVAGVFQDCRLGSEPWPPQATRGAPLGGVTMGSEWFGGHLFQSRADKACYLIAGFTAYNLIRLNGLESLKVLKGDELNVTADDVRTAEALAQRHAAVAAANREISVGRLPAPPVLDGKLDDFKARFVEWTSGPYRIRAALAITSNRLCLAYDVSGDSNPMVNGGKDILQLFVTGDSVDLQLGTAADAPPGRAEPVAGDVRLLISVFEGKPVAVLYRWKTDGERRPVTFTCPWRSHTVDAVDVVPEAQISILRRGNGYAVEAAVPLEALGFTPTAGQRHKADLGVIFSDAKGDNRAGRVYWANKATGLVADVPGEIMASPQAWGWMTVE